MIFHWTKTSGSRHLQCAGVQSAVPQRCHWQEEEEEEDSANRELTWHEASAPAIFLNSHVNSPRPCTDIRARGWIRSNDQIKAGEDRLGSISGRRSRAEQHSPPWLDSQSQCPSRFGFVKTDDIESEGRRKENPIRHHFRKVDKRDLHVCWKHSVTKTNTGTHAEQILRTLWHYLTAAWFRVTVQEL